MKSSLRACLMLLTFLVIQSSSAAFANDAYLRANRLGIAFISSIDIPHPEVRYERALSLGAGWNRWPMYWDRIETRNGVYDWEAYDELVNADLAQGLSLNVILLGIPSFHRDGETIEDLSLPIFSDETDVPAPNKAINPEHAWAQFVQTAVMRYMPNSEMAQTEGWGEGEGVRVWEIWNEPDFEMFWSGGVGDYARLLKVAYLVIKSVDPEATVMLGGLLYPTEANWLAQVLAVYQDEPDREEDQWYMDAVGIHNYGDAWRSGWLTLVARQTMVEYDFIRPIWMTETGVPVWDDYPGPVWVDDDAQARSALATVEQQAAFLIQSAAYAWAEGAQVVFYHQLYDDCGNQPPGTDFPATRTGICPAGEICAGDVFGLFSNPESAVCFAQHPTPDSARPVAFAYALLAEVFGAHSFSRRGVIEDVREDGAATITFIRPDTRERVVVIWNTTDTSIEISLAALGSNAGIQTMDAAYSSAAQDGAYTLALPGAELPLQRFLEDRAKIDIGGEPLILIERVTDDAEWARLLYLTFESTEPPAALATETTAAEFSQAQIEGWQAESPTGVILISLQDARLRTAPDVETSTVVGTLRTNQHASVVGRTDNAEWLLLEMADGGRVWIASFLGDVYGNLSAVPVIEADESQ
jgi:hypothetical protein